MRSVLVVAGSDSGGGAGIQADLKALAAVGVHGTTAITSVTAQNTRGVVSTHPLPVEAIRDQIRAVRTDIAIQAAKTGMLYSPEIVEVVATELAELDCPLVVDPVMVATAGSSLHVTGLPDALRDRLLPMTTVLTPNLDEAEALTGQAIQGVEDLKEAAAALHQMGPQTVLMKGGHLKGELVDVLYDGEAFHSFRDYRYPMELHGSGCAYASSIAGHLARGLGVVESVRHARKKVAAGFATSYAVGKGLRVINAAYTEDRWRVWEALQEATKALLEFLPVALVPEVGVNLGYALPGAEGVGDVCAIRGRIIRVGKRPAAVGPPGFGASLHVARIILAAMEFDPSRRSAMNVRYTEELVKRCRAAGLSVGTFDRNEEPAGTQTMEWGTQVAIRGAEAFPHAIYDLGGPGKVAMIRFLGRTPGEVVERVREVVTA